MERNNVVRLGPRKFELFIAMQYLPPDLADTLCLLFPKEAFNVLSVWECLDYHREVTARLGKIAEPLWADPCTQFLVVNGDVIYASRMSFVEFDQVGFESTMPYLSTIISRPILEAPLAPVIPLFGVSVEH